MSLGLAGAAQRATSDVAADRESARRGRLRRLAWVLAGVAALVWARWLAGSPVRLAAPRLPHGLVAYLPAGGLVLVLVVVLVGPVLLAGRSPHVLVRPGESGVLLSDVRGMPVVVDEVARTLALFLDHRRFSQEMGGTARRAILFEGPPGTGKTFVAKALAGEAGVPFLFVSSTAFQSMYYGQTSRKMRAYFRALRRSARAEGGAIGFIEEIDAIGASRAGTGASAGREGIAGVVNELLVQLQSFEEPPASLVVARVLVDLANRLLPPEARLRRPAGRGANVLVVGATNRASDLDAALLRPGRFDRVIRFDPPARAGRADVLEHYLARKAHESELDAPGSCDELAGMTLGYTPAMLEHLLDEALVWALRRGSRRMTWEDITRARMTEELGIEQPARYSDDERLRVATHEAGHATLALACAGTSGRTVEVLSIVKRRDALGVTARSEGQERYVRTRSELEAELRVSLGGLVAEEMMLGEHSSGAAADLDAATRLAARMVGSFGMAGGLVSYDAASRGELVALVMSSDEARARLEKLLAEAGQAVRQQLERSRAVLVALTEALVEREELLGKEIEMVAAGAREQVGSIDLRERRAAQGG